MRFFLGGAHNSLAVLLPFLSSNSGLGNAITSVRQLPDRARMMSII